MTLPRILVGTAVSALVVVSLTAAPASAATTIGSSGFSPASGACTPDVTFLQASPPAGTTYSAATAGVITSWSFHAADATTLKLKVFHYTGTSSIYTVTAASETASAPASSTTSFPTRLPIAANDGIGVTLKSGGCALANTTGLVLFASGDLAPGSPPAGYSLSPTTAIPVSATIEADADGDGYGDETQDLCPTSAATHAACASTGGGGGGGGGGGATVPDTKVTKGPTQTRKTTVKYSFTSTVAGSTFECRLKGKGVHTVQDKTFQPCTSPRTYKKLTPGSYKFSVRAISGGLTDASPVTVKLKVLPKS